MLPYIILLLISIICLFFPEKKWAKVLSLGSLFIVSAFRGENVGTDTVNYINGYRNYIDGVEFAIESIGQQAEFITNGIVYLLSSLGLSGRYIIIFFSVVILGSIPLISKRLKVSPVYLSFLFLTGQFIPSLNIARQIAATMLIGLAATYIYEESVKKSLRFFVLVIIAAGIHSFSVVFLILYLLRFIRMKYRTVSVFVILSLIFGFTGIIDVSHILNGMMGSLGGYADSYFDAFTSNRVRSLFGYLIPVVITGVKLFLLKNVDNRSMSLYCVALCVPLFFNNSSEILERMLIIFGFLSSFIIAINMGDYEKKKSTYRLLSFLMIIPLSYMYLSYVARNHEILPFYFGF